MKIRVEQDDGDVTEYLDVTDFYIALRRAQITDHVLTLNTSSWSYGANVRELVKEVQQSLVELQDFLRSHRDNSS